MTKRGKDNKSHSCHIAAAFTKNCRGKGISKGLMDFALEYLKKKGVWMIRAYVYNNNKSSVHLFCLVDLYGQERFISISGAKKKENI